MKRAKNDFWRCKSYSFISVCFMLGCLFASGVYFCPIPHQVRAATILKHPLCHFYLGAHFAVFKSLKTIIWMSRIDLRIVFKVEVCKLVGLERAVGT